MMLILIGPHEFGHFIVAKMCNVQVNEFAIGMGPALWKKKKGETQYSLRAIPIGGYNAMEGEDGSSDNPRAFNNQTPLKKIAILLAGVTMNVLIALLVTIIAVSITGVPVNKIDSVSKDSPAAEAGLEAGDRIVAVDGVTTDSWTDVLEAISSYQEGDKMEIVINRDGEESSRFLTPRYNEETERYTIGIVAGTSKSPLVCIPYGVQYTKILNDSMLEGFSMMFSGKLTRKDVAGPIGLVKVVNETASYGIESFLILLALVSLNLALINMLPIPGLDGGKILFVLLKVISRGRITDDMEGKATVAGMLVLLLLFVLITTNDISNMFH